MDQVRLPDLGRRPVKKKACKIAEQARGLLEIPVLVMHSDKRFNRPLALLPSTALRTQRSRRKGRKEHFREQNAFHGALWVS
jgi:hypothetical protein